MTAIGGERTYSVLLSTLSASKNLCFVYAVFYKIAGWHRILGHVLDLIFNLYPDIDEVWFLYAPLRSIHANDSNSSNLQSQLCYLLAVTSPFLFLRIIFTDVFVQ